MLLRLLGSAHRLLFTPSSLYTSMFIWLRLQRPSLKVQGQTTMLQLVPELSLRLLSLKLWLEHTIFDLWKLRACPTYHQGYFKKGLDLYIHVRGQVDEPLACLKLGAQHWIWVRALFFFRKHNQCVVSGSADHQRKSAYGVHDFHVKLCMTFRHCMFRMYKLFPASGFDTSSDYSKWLWHILSLNLFSQWAPFMLQYFQCSAYSRANQGSYSRAVLEALLCLKHFYIFLK